MIELGGGIAFGLVCGWLLAQRLAEPSGGAATVAAGAVAVTVVAGEAALLAGRVAALGLLAAAGVGALLRIVFRRAVARRPAWP